MAWFKRKKKGIYTETKDKKNLPEGLWHKCPNCETVIYRAEYEKNLNVCPKSTILLAN